MGVDVLRERRAVESRERGEVAGEVAREGKDGLVSTFWIRDRDQGLGEKHSKETGIDR